MSKAKKFELFIGYLGNGATVCNSAFMENGDYKQIAHISVAGNIKLYVKEDYIPKDAMEKIKATAQSHREQTIKRLDLELSGDYGYDRTLDEICNYTDFFKSNQLLNDLKDKEKTERIEMIKDYYLTNF